MLRSLYFRLRFGSFLHNANGAKAMAEVLLTRLTHDALEEAGPIRTRNANLQFEREHMLGYLAQSTSGTAASSGLFGRVLASMVLMVALVASVTYLYFAALASWMSTALPGSDAGVVAAGFLALTLAGGAIYACNGIVQAAFTIRDDGPARRHLLLRGTLWTLLLGCMEMIVLLLTVGVSQAASVGAAVLPFRYAGVLVSLLLPILGGFLSVDLSHAIEAYRTASRLRHAELRIAEIVAETEQHRATWQHAVHCKALGYWDLFQSFTVQKEFFDARRKSDPGVPAPFDSFEAFMGEAERRIHADALALMGVSAVSGDGVLDLKQPRLSVPMKPSHTARQPEDVRLRWAAPSAV